MFVNFKPITGNVLTKVRTVPVITKVGTGIKHHRTHRSQWENPPSDKTADVYIFQYK